MSTKNQVLILAERIALTAKLSDLAGEEARETCLDKNGEARG